MVADNTAPCSYDRMQARVLWPTGSTPDGNTFLLRCGLISHPGTFTTKLHGPVFIGKMTVAQLVKRFSTSYKS